MQPPEIATTDRHDDAPFGGRVTAFALRLSPFFRAVSLLRFDGSSARRFNAARADTAAVEFAIVRPVLILLMLGMVTYGGYCLTAHTVQQIANDAARVAIAGLDDNEAVAGA